MRLSAKVVKNYANVNNFDYANQWIIRAGEPNTLYFQLVDLDQDSLRYLTAQGVSNQPASVAVTFPSIDDDEVITVTASLADPADPSVWKVVLTALQIPKSGNVLFAVTEGAVVRKFSGLQLMAVELPGNDGSC
jgi:hypothetical protein